MLVGGGLGNAVLFSIGKALKQNGCKVLYFAGYKKKADRYKIEEIEEASDVTIWACDDEVLSFNRPSDKAIKANIVQAILAYGEGSLGETIIKLEDVDRIITIGSDKMMNAVAYERHHSLKHYFKKAHIAIGSINSPMQCMMKEICAQCLQRHVDPVTQKESYVFSCFNQDQLLDEVDFNHLSARLSQNTLQEKVGAKLIQNLLADQL
jgi:NAD(P)H-flavin reductase